jgi:DNA-binding MarR family transcriptional regulator
MEKVGSLARPNAKKPASGAAGRTRRADRKGADASDEIDVSSTGIDLGGLDDYIGFHLRVAQDASFRAFARNAGQNDLKPGRFAALVVIDRNPGISQGALGRTIGRDKSTITPLVQFLHKDHLIERRPRPGDRRSNSLFVTPSGKLMLARLVRHARDHDRKLDAIVGGHKAEFIELLKRIAHQLT